MIIVAFKLIVPLEPHTASRPNWGVNGRPTRAYMPDGYRKFRERFNDWFMDYLEKTDSELFRYLTHLQDGRPIRHEVFGKNVIEDDFFGYSVTVVCVITRTASDTRPFPIATRTADIDNYAKAVTDSIFSSEPAKYFHLNDRWMQELHAQKRYTRYGTDEKAHIEIIIRRMENIEGMYS